jgi:hypothetical protein
MKFFDDRPPMAWLSTTTPSDRNRSIIWPQPACGAQNWSYVCTVESPVR